MRNTGPFRACRYRVKEIHPSISRGANPDRVKKKSKPLERLDSSTFGWRGPHLSIRSERRASPVHRGSRAPRMPMPAARRRSSSVARQTRAAQSRQARLTSAAAMTPRGPSRRSTSAMTSLGTGRPATSVVASSSPSSALGFLSSRERARRRLWSPPPVPLAAAPDEEEGDGDSATGAAGATQTWPFLGWPHRPQL
jgi:hypothetical protein